MKLSEVDSFKALKSYHQNKICELKGPRTFNKFYQGMNSSWPTKTLIVNHIVKKPLFKNAQNILRTDRPTKWYIMVNSRDLKIPT